MKKLSKSHRDYVRYHNERSDDLRAALGFLGSARVAARLADLTLEKVSDLTERLGVCAARLMATNAAMDDDLVDEGAGK